MGNLGQCHNLVGHSKPLTLYPARVEFKSKIVDAIRVRLVEGRQNGAANGAAASSVQQQLLQPQQSVAQPSQQSQKPPINGRTLPPLVDDEIPF